jgi:hypothetical protein
MLAFDLPGVDDAQPDAVIDGEITPIDDVAPGNDEVAVPADPETDVEIYTISPAGPAADAPDDCSADPVFAAAVDILLIGPLTPEQFAAQPANSVFRLQDLIALLALDIAEHRRVATVINQPCE